MKTYLLALVRLYQDTWYTLKPNLKNYLLLILILGSITFFVTLFALNDFSFNRLNNSNLGELSFEPDYWNQTREIFINNWLAGLQVLFFALLPIGFLYKVSLIILIMLCSQILVKLYLSNLFFIGLIGLLPHGILEFPLLILMVVIAGKLNKTVRINVKNILSMGT